MTMRITGLMLFVAAAAYSQPADPIAGEYRFVELGIRKVSASSVVTATNGGGTITFDPSGTAQFIARTRSGKEAAADASGERVWSRAAGASSITLASAMNRDVELEVRQSGDGGVLVGGSKSADGNFHLFAAVKASGREMSAAAFSGRYRGAYLTLSGGEPGLLATGFVEFFADGRGSLTRLKRIGHAATVDDVNRLDIRQSSTYTLQANGSGVVQFPLGSEFLTGEREVAVSPDGEIVLGYSTSGERDFLMLVRQPEPIDDSAINDVFWLAELFAETDFIFNAGAVRFGSAIGSLRSDGNGNASVAERVHRGASRLFLTTTNTLVVNFDGVASFGPQRKQRLDNFGFNSRAFAGALVGMEGELSLEHGIFIGVRAGAAAPSGIAVSPHGVLNAASLGAPTAPIAVGELVSLFGSGFANRTFTAPAGALPAELGGVRVLINGTAAPLALVSPNQINLVVPSNLDGESATVQVEAPGGMSNAVRVGVAPTSPGVFAAIINGVRRSIVVRPDYSLVTPERPARPGETLIVMASGLGPVDLSIDAGTPAPSSELSRTTDPGLRVYLQGLPVETHFSGLAPGFSGLYQINFTVPAGIRTLSASPLAIQTSDSFTDLADIPASAQ
jgi:uncharacterized protein (TIGR03437 family)